MLVNSEKVYDAFAFDKAHFPILPLSFQMSVTVVATVPLLIPLFSRLPLSGSQTLNAIVVSFLSYYIIKVKGESRPSLLIKNKI